MLNALAYFLLFCAVFIVGSPHGIVHWLIHALCLVFSLTFLHKLTKYYLFWFVLLLCYFCASEPRFSVEYYFIAMGFMSWGLSGWWLNLKKRDRAIFFLTCFSLLFVSNFSLIGFAERGAYLAWLPVFLALYFKPRENRVMFSLSGVLLLLSNKASTALAFFSILSRKFKAYMFVIAAFVAAGIAYLIKDSMPTFFETSINSRLSIWNSAFQGFLANPILGHGFETFILDYPEHKIYSHGWGSMLAQQIAHGHSLFIHYIFELGLIGVILLIALFYLLYKRAPKALLPFLVISLFDVPLVLFGEFLLASLVLAPFFQKKAADENASIKVLFSQVPKKYMAIPIIIAYALALYSFIPSAVGHFYYDQENYTQAIKWDKKNPLYYLVRGVEGLDYEVEGSSLRDFQKSVSQGPRVGYMYGYLAASELSVNNYAAAKKHIEDAMSLSGTNPYWDFIAALANYDDEDMFNNYYWRAQKRRPQIFKEVGDPNAKASMYIGSAVSDVRVLSFLRKGPKLYLPLPYIQDCPESPWLLRKRLLAEAKLKKKSKSQAGG